MKLKDEAPDQATFWHASTLAFQESLEMMQSGCNPMTFKLDPEMQQGAEELKAMLMRRVAPHNRFEHLTANAAVKECGGMEGITGSQAAERGTTVNTAAALRFDLSGRRLPVEPLQPRHERLPGSLHRLRPGSTSSAACAVARRGAR